MNAVDPSKPSPAAADQRPYEPSMEEILASIRRIIADDQSGPGRAGREEELNLRASLEGPAPASAPAQPSPTSIQTIPAQDQIIPAQDTADQARAEQADWTTGPSAETAAHQAAPADTRVEPVAPIAAQVAKPDVPKAGPPPPRVVPVTATLGHIAAPQFAMPDRPVRPAEPVKVEREDPVPLPFEAARAPQRTAGTADPGGRMEATGRTEIIEKREDTTAQAGSHLFSSRTDQSVTAAFTTLAASRVLGNDDVLKGMVGDVIRPMLKRWLDENLPGLVERLVRDEIERVSRGGR